MNVLENLRRRELSAIHIAKKELGLDDATYRYILRNSFNVESSADLDQAGRRRLLDYFTTRGWKGTGRDRRAAAQGANPFPGGAVPSEGRALLLGKIYGLLRSSGRAWRDDDHLWNYADALARRIGKVDSIRFAPPDALHKIVAALEYDKRRREKITLAPPEGETT